MSKARNAAMLLSSLSIYRGVRENRVFSTFYSLLTALDDDIQSFLEKWGRFFDTLSKEGCSGRLAYCLSKAAFYDENAFSKAAAEGKADNMNEYEKAAVKRDIHAIRYACNITADDILEDYKYSGHLGDCKSALPVWGIGETVEEFSDEENVFERLSGFYRKNGYGIFARYRAFIWRDKSIMPVPFPDKVSFSDLICYKTQRNEVIKNTKAFLRGIYSNNVLLYGDRGTGKSSTVKALLNEYYTQGLRMVEMPKEKLSEFPLLVEKTADIPLKFIIFIDDLSFGNDDKSYASLKAVLEGGLAARPDNTLIYATSNRRHLIKETFRDRDGDDMHINDTMQETLSLSDRFGLSVNFGHPDKETYIEIVTGLADKYSIDYDREKLIADAERWAIGRGGRSPRCALQFISSVLGRE